MNNPSSNHRSQVDRPSRLPGRAEFQVLEVLWREAPLSVACVRAELGPGPQPAYTTVMTMLEQLFRKGLVRRRKQGRAFLYEPTQDRESVVRLLAVRFAENFFQADLAACRNFFDSLTALAAEPPLPTRHLTPGREPEPQCSPLPDRFPSALVWED